MALGAAAYGTLDLALAAQSAAVAVERRQPCHCGDLAAIEPA
jgi:hypothetical protein